VLLTYFAKDSDYSPMIDEISDELYGPEYYAKHCGPMAYQRSCPHWSAFFGSIAEQLIRSFQPRRVFDAGCAHGFLVEAFWDRGVEAWGRDISSYAISQLRPDMRPYCTAGSIAERIEGRYDLVTCIEVLEHIGEDQAAQAITMMTAITDRILFSSSPTDFDEPTHINVRPPLYWLRLFAEHGFAPVLSYDASYLTPQALVLERTAEGPTEQTLSACAELVRVRLQGAERDRRITELNAQQAERDRLLEAAAGREAVAAARIAQLEEARAEAAAAAAARIAQLEEAHAHAQAAAAIRDRDDAGLAAQLTQARSDLRSAQGELARVSAAYQAIAGSTAWRLTQPLRGLAERMSPGNRRRLRRLLGALRRSATFPAASARRRRGPAAPDEPGLRLPPIPAAAAQSPASYDAFVAADRQRLAEERPEMLRHAGLMPYRPNFAVIIDGTDEALIRHTNASLREQIWAHWHSLESAGFSDISAAGIDGDFIVLVRAGDTLAPDALYEFASAVNADPQLDMIYADEDSIDAAGRRSQPFFKPGWSPDYLESFNYIGHAACFRTGLARAHLAANGLFDFILRFTEANPRLLHLRKVLYHRGAVTDMPPADRDSAEIAALQGRLERSGRRGTVTPGSYGRSYWDITLSLGHEPLVSIVIPTAGKIVQWEGRDWDLLQHCVGSILTCSTYRNFEIVLIDNGDLGPTRKTALESAGCRFVTYREAEFNLPRKLNLGVGCARGELLLLMNDDMELIAADWIERLLEHFEKPHVGVVGAKLLYPDGTIQHAGVVHNYGNPDHVRRRWPRADPGYFYSTCAVHNFGAVTGACMMTRRDVYQRVGGYSEDLSISYNDVDYCQKVRELGLTVVYAPRAELFHFESQSREAKLDHAEWLFYHQRWAQQVISDEFYNELQLTVAPPTFEICTNPRIL
jgi:glycosyltransferase involved in cell wall biosynthesis/SAM-dependent methyltransferase